MSDNEEREGGGAEKKAKIEPSADAPKEIYIAVDIERVGASFKYGILAIGACVGFSNGVIIEKRMFASKVPPKEGFEPRTYDWWQQFPDVLQHINNHAEPDHIRKFHAWLLELDRVWGPFGRDNVGKVKARLVSDNPAYDIGVINLEFYKLFGDEAKPMAEMFSAGYVPTDDPTEQEAFLSAAQHEFVEAFITAPHDHNPENDATQIYQRRCGLRALT